MFGIKKDEKMYLKRTNGDVIGSGETIRKIAENNTANLSSADLSFANLSSADLSSANLRFANLRFANLRFANLSSADLRSADFSGTKRGDWVINGRVIQISGLYYPIIVFSEHMEIGCECHSFNDWSEFNDKRILQMDGREALEFWNENKWFLLTLCEQQVIKQEKE